jgi:aquaporin Z
MINKKLAAEMFGTFWLVFGGCGAAILAGGSIGFVGVSLAFGLSVLTMAYAVGGISGGHFNPAVTVGLAVAGKFDWKDVIPYTIAQVVGSIIAAAALNYILMGKAGVHGTGGFASNGFGDLSPNGFSMHAAMLTEIIMTGFFMIVILGATSKRVPSGFAPIAIGLCLTLIHLVSIPVTNTSVNPARSTGVALYADTAATGQLWLFWMAPLIGAAIGAIIYKNFICED